MTNGYRRLLKWARLLHVYLTLFGLALLLFFAVTGLMLNHEEWFGSPDPEDQPPPERTTTVEGKVPSALLEPLDEEGVAHLLREGYGVRGSVTSFDADEEAVNVMFKGPGVRVKAAIERDSGKMALTRETSGAVGVLMALHRGREAGWAWSFLVDATAVLFVVVSLTGLVLWTSLKNRARYGAAVIAAGLAVAVAVYFVWVPR